METDFLSKLSGELGNLALSNLTGYMVTLAKNIVLAIIIYYTIKNEAASGFASPRRTPGNKENKSRGRSAAERAPENSA